MALTSRGSAQNAKMRFILAAFADGSNGEINYAAMRTGYSVRDMYYSGTKLYAGSTNIGTKGGGSAIGDTLEIEVNGSTLTLRNITKATTLLTVTNSVYPGSGVWQTDPATCTFVSFTSLDAAAPAHNHNAIAFGAGF